MIHIKNTQELDSMKKGGQMLSETLWEVLKAVKPGVTELELDQLAEKLIKEKGGASGFKEVPGYTHTICVATNDVVVHGIPRGDYQLKEGDIICVDCGVYYDGLHTDMAETVIVGSEDSVSDDIKRFLQAGKEALEAGIQAAKGGNRVGHISQAIESIVEKKYGYSVAESLIGHGVGRQLHEEPEVPGYLVGPIDKTPLLKPGMTIAIEVIYTMGSPDLAYAPDGWTIKTEDGSLSAVFERSVAITDGKPIILTK